PAEAAQRDELAGRRGFKHRREQHERAAGAATAIAAVPTIAAATAVARVPAIATTATPPAGGIRRFATVTPMSGRAPAPGDPALCGKELLGIGAGDIDEAVEAGATKGA